MAWADIPGSPFSVVETSAGVAVFSAFDGLNPKATVHVMVVRTDAAAAGDDWHAAIYDAQSGALRSRLPISGPKRRAAAQLEIGFPVSGLPGYMVMVQNADADPTDVVAADIYIQDDGVSL